MAVSMRKLGPFAVTIFFGAIVACGSSSNGSGFDDGGGDNGDGGGVDGIAGDGGNLDTSFGGDIVGPPVGDPKTCAEAAARKSYIGCDYWPTVIANNVWSVFDFAAVVANACTDPADI